MMTRTIAWCVLLLTIWGGSKASLAQSTLQITYVANEGVLIADGETQVLVDGLHRPYSPTYAVLGADEREQAEIAQPPFDEVDVVLVSHVHRDHFHAEAVGRHLQHNPQAILIASQQVADSVARDFGAIETIQQQIRVVTPGWQTEERVDLGRVQVDVLGLRHGSERFRWVQNLGHLVHIGNQTLLHIGDADATLENFAAFRLPERDIDIAFIPYWFLLYPNGQAIVRDWIQPDHIIALHIPPGEAADIEARIREHFPDAEGFTNLLETRSYK